MKKSGKILAILLSVAMICSSLPAYATVDDASSEMTGNMTSQSASSNEGTEGIAEGTEEGTGANQNAESSSQAELGTVSDASGNEAVNNEENAQPEDNSNIPQQNAANSQDAPDEQKVCYLNGGDMDIYYSDGYYYITQNGVKYRDAYAPIICSDGEVSNQLHLHDFTPDEVNAAPYVIIRDLWISSDSTAIEIDDTVNLDVEKYCSLTTTSKTAAAIDVAQSAHLTISGSGSLYVSSSGNGAAIGAAGMHTSTGEHMAPTSGNIEITDNVKVTAENTGNGAGIGGGYNYGATCKQYGGDAKDITISGNAYVTAISNGGSAAIGGGGVKAASFKGDGGDCSSVTIKDNAMVKATAYGEGAAAIGSGANNDKQLYDACAGDVGTISILDSATVYATGEYIAIGSGADYSTAFGLHLLGHSDPGELYIQNTASLDAYSMTDVPISSKYKSLRYSTQNNNMIVGNFKDNSALTSEKVLQVMNADSKQYTKNLTMPAGTKSFAFSTPSEQNYAILSIDAAPDASNNYQMEQAIQNIDNQNFLFASRQLESENSFSDYSVSVKFLDASLKDASANMDLSNGSITISKIDSLIYVEQNGQTTVVLPNKENITISQSSDQTNNNITIEGSIDGAQPIILKNLNISCEQPIVLEEGANVNFIFHNNNSLTATSCKKPTDYPAIEVPKGATVTLSGDGSLDAGADGYAAAIGTEGYYRDGDQHSDGDKSSGTIQIDGTLNVKAHSAYGAGIGGGAISGSVCEQHAFDNGTVIIKGNAIVEALGSTEGSYSAGIGGGGCYTSTCSAVGGDGGDVQILDNAQVTAASKGKLGAGIGGGGGHGHSANGFGGDGKSFTANNNAVVVATGANYGPGIGGGGAQQSSSYKTYPGNSGTCSVLGYSRVTVLSGGNASGYGIGGHTGGSGTYTARYTDPVIDLTAILQEAQNADLLQPSINMDLSQGSITISQTYSEITVEQNDVKLLTFSGNENITITQSSSETTGNNITIKGSVNRAQPIILENLNISCAQPIVVEDGADVNLIFHDNSSLTATNCKESTDYPALEVPGGATVILSGDGSLEATADGYAAAIGTRGYYRDGDNHSDDDKSSGTVQIDGTLNVKAHSAYGAGIGGGAISGSSCEQHAFDNGTVIIKGNAVVEAFGSMEGSYSAGIGGGGCYTSTCVAVGGDGGDVQILDNAQVTAASQGSFGAGIGGGGACGKTADSFGGDGESFKADNNAVVVATGSKYGPGIGGGGAQQKTICATHPGDSGSCSIFGNANVTAQHGNKHAKNFGTGGHTGGMFNYNGNYTEPVLDETAIFNA